MAVREGEDVPAVRRPLIAQHVAVGELARHHAADERVVDAGVVVGEEDAEPLAGLHGQRLRLELLGVPGAHRELAFEGDDLRRVDAGAEEVPEGRFAGSGCEADARRAAVDVVRDVGGFDVAGQRADSAAFGLGEQRMIGEAVVFEQRREGAGAAPEAERIDRQHRELGRDVIAPIAGGCVFPGERFAHDHPQRVAGRGAVARGQHELVAIRVLGASIVEVQAASIAAGEMRDDVERRIGQGSAEMSGLRVVAEQHQRHGGHEADVLELLQVAEIERVDGSRRNRDGLCAHGASNTTLRRLRASDMENR